MAKLPRDRAHRLRALALAVLAALLSAGAASALELEGTWHVLVHYTDDNTVRPEQMRWNDRIWIFERKGSRLQWTEYPIVVFSDESGRFERTSTGYSRILGGWEPSEGQIANIQSGLEINTRGSRKKSLKADGDSWVTARRARAHSASVISYEENWSIEKGSDLPVFLKRDIMGSERSETMEGVTRYETQEVKYGDVLLGSYERDGTRRGTFVMRRSGDVGFLKERSQSEIQRDAQQRALQLSPEVRTRAREVVEGLLEERSLELTPERVEALIEEAVALAAQGIEFERVSREMAKRVDALVREQD